MLIYLPVYSILICQEHRCAVYSLNRHLKSYYKLSATARHKHIAAYSYLKTLPPDQVNIPAAGSAPLAELGEAQDAFACCCQLQGGEISGSSSSSGSSSVACRYISISWKEMRQYLNRQHSVKLTCWAARLAKLHGSDNHAGQL